MKVGIVLKDRSHEDALKYELEGDFHEWVRWLLLNDVDGFVLAGRYVIAKPWIKYIYLISE